MKIKSNRKKTSVALIILDGFGTGRENDGNAFFKANTPFWDELSAKYPLATLLPVSREAWRNYASLGAGREISDPPEVIDNEIKTRNFYKNKTHRCDI